MSEDTIEEIRDQVELLTETTARLRDLGDEEDIPVVEHTAERIDGVVATLLGNLPPKSTTDEDRP